MTPRTFPPAPGWARDGHRIKAPLEYGRGPEKVWVYGALRVRDGQEVTFTAPSRNTVGYLTLLTLLDEANPDGGLLAQSAGRLVAPLPPGSLRRAVLRRCQGD